MKIMIFVLLFFLGLSEESEDHKGQHPHKGEHIGQKEEEDIITGTVNVFVDYEQPRPWKVSVLVKPNKPDAKVHIVEGVDCDGNFHYHYDKVKGYFHVYPCKYEISVASIAKEIIDGIKVRIVRIGAMYDGKKKWTKPFIIPEGHEVDVNFDLVQAFFKRNNLNWLELKLVGDHIKTHPVEVRIVGDVHLNLPRSKAFKRYYHYHVPDEVTIWIETAEGRTIAKIPSKTCDDKHFCHYDGTFHVNDEHEGFIYTASIANGEKARGLSIAIPQTQSIHEDFVLDASRLRPINAFSHGFPHINARNALVIIFYWIYSH
ncbi:hypothetical protein DdX_15995 [Ditylenchus destructor]|uniref:Uncharacterized protein n=1 Tax=Ditylenchus destructor TaxID=166010 RepID=A0AAD4R0A8_9BILA|nr:hypothetical protein DdX_15995 [Ditylenchus destructor]